MVVPLITSLKKGTTIMRQFKRGHSRTSSDENKGPYFNLINTTVYDWYKQKHGSPSIDEIALVNSIEIENCPYCKSDKFVIYDHRKDGVKRLICKSCKRKFNPLTNTLFDSHKIPISEWIEFIFHLLSYDSVLMSAYSNRNDSHTGYYWLNKLFIAIKDIQKDVMLSGRIYIDETYLSVMPKDVIRKEGKKLRGLSRNKICIITAVDEHGHLLICAKGNGKPSKDKIKEVFENHIKKNSTIVHDGEKSHSILVEMYELKEEIHPTKETKGLKDKDNPMEPVNGVHRKIKRFIKAHGGYNRNNMQDWLNVIYFMIKTEKEKSIENVIARLLKMIISTPKKLRYRDYQIRKTQIIS